MQYSYRLVLLFFVLVKYPLIAQNGVAVYQSDLEMGLLHQNTPLYDKRVRWVNTFGEAPVGDDVAYINSLLNFSVAVDQGNFSEKYNVLSGSE